MKWIKKEVPMYKIMNLAKFLQIFGIYFFLLW